MSVNWTSWQVSTSSKTTLSLFNFHNGRKIMFSSEHNTFAFVNVDCFFLILYFKKPFRPQFDIV